MGDFNAAIFGLDLCAAGCNLAALVAPLVTATGALRSILALIPVVRGLILAVAMATVMPFLCSAAL